LASYRLDSHLTTNSHQHHPKLSSRRARGR
jgi:hypothetical protein